MQLPTKPSQKAVEDGSDEQAVICTHWCVEVVYELKTAKNTSDAKIGLFDGHLQLFLPIQSPPH